MCGYQVEFAPRNSGLGIDKLADKFGEGSLKLTTRQAFQLYGILKCNLKQTMKEINDTLLDTLAACGDVNEYDEPGNPFESELHGQAGCCPANSII